MWIVSSSCAALTAACKVEKQPAPAPTQGLVVAAESAAAAVTPPTSKASQIVMVERFISSSSNARPDAFPDRSPVGAAFVARLQRQFVPGDRPAVGTERTVS